MVRRQHVDQHNLDLGLEGGDKEMGGQRLIHAAFCVTGKRSGQGQGEVCVCRVAFMCWRHPRVSGVKNESEGDQSGVCSLRVLGCIGWFRTQCQQMGAETINLDLAWHLRQDFCYQASPLTR